MKRSAATSCSTSDEDLSGSKKRMVLLWCLKNDRPNAIYVQSNDQHYDQSFSKVISGSACSLLIMVKQTDLEQLREILWSMVTGCLSVLDNHFLLLLF